MKQIVRYLFAVMLLVVGVEASAQNLKERGCVREGNELFNAKDYKKSIECYEEALTHDPNSFEAKFNLASALYQDERYKDSEDTLLHLMGSSSRTEKERGEVAYNLGNAQFAQKKYKEALMSYRTAMRCNPNDEDAKFNYAYTKLKLQQQQQQQQEQDKQEQEQQQDQQQEQQDQSNGGDDKQNDESKENNQDQNQGQQGGGQDKQDENKQDEKKNDPKQNNGDDKEDKNQDNNKNEEQDKNNNDNKNGQDKEGQQPQNQDGQNNPQQGGQRPQSGMSPEQQEALLQAVQAEEDKTQDKLEKKKGAVLVFGGKNW